MSNKRGFILIIGSLVVVSAVVAGSVAAQEKQNAAGYGGMLSNILKNINIGNFGGRIGTKAGPVITGNVTAINGTTISIASKVAYVPGSTNSLLQATTYTIDASKATIRRINPPMPRTPGGRVYPMSVNAPTEPMDNLNVVPPINVNSEPLVNTPPNPTGNYSAGASGNMQGSSGRIMQRLPLKNFETTITVSDIHIGDLLIVRGTVTGTAIVATNITVSPALGGVNGEQKTMVTGTVQTVSGTTLTVVSNATSSTAATTYTVDASAAVVRKYTTPPVPATTTMGGSVAGGNNQPATNSATGGSASGVNMPLRRPMESTISVSSINVGDSVSIQGTVSGTNIIAIEIIDGMKLTNGQGATGIHQNSSNLSQEGAALKKEVEAVKPGLWAKIVSFFSGLFGKK
jgi:hypothetical protein